MIGSTFSFVECADCDNLSGYTLIEGFPGMGLVGTIAAKYLIDNLNLNDNISGHIESDAFMPVVRIHKGIPVYPARFYIDKKRKLIILISEQVIQTETAHGLSEATLNWIRAKKIKKVISLAGIKSPQPKTKEVYGIASNEKGLKELKKNNISVIEEGITTGVTAMILTKLKQFDDITAISLMSDVKFSADYEAAATMIKKLSAVLNLKIDTEPLMKEAKKTEQTLIKSMQEMKDTHDETQISEHKLSMTT